jgi:AraC-like DNA-binding protein
MSPAGGRDVFHTREFETHDRDEAIAAMSAMVDSRLRVEGRGDLHCKISTRTSDELTDASVSVGTTFRAANAPVDLIHIVTAGGVYVVDAGGTAHVATTGQSIRPPTHIACNFLVPQGEFVVTTLLGSAVRDVAREVFVDGPATLDREAVRPVSPRMERLWRASIDFYRAHILQPGMYENGLIRREATRSLMTTAILAFGLHVPTEHSATPTVAARRARAYIDDHLAEPMTLHDVATAARLSARGLQYAFHRAYGIAPMSYVRAARLSAARQDLLSADRDTGSTVSTIARRWGFVHLGRFASSYRTTYGETPRATLDR